MILVMNEYQRQGYDPNLGVDKHFLDAARADGKPIRQLETIESQMELFLQVDDKLDDVRVPAQPYPVGQAVPERYAGRVEIVDDVALVLAVDRVVAVDVSDPAAPASCPRLPVSCPRSRWTCPASVSAAASPAAPVRVRRRAAARSRFPRAACRRRRRDRPR